jgi:hypothetical protein
VCLCEHVNHFVCTRVSSVMCARACVSFGVLSESEYACVVVAWSRVLVKVCWWRKRSEHPYRQHSRRAIGLRWHGNPVRRSPRTH